MCCVATSDPRCFLPVTMYGTTHAHLVHMCWPLLWGLRQMGRSFATFGTYTQVSRVTRVTGCYPHGSATPNTGTAHTTHYGRKRAPEAQLAVHIGCATVQSVLFSYPEVLHRSFGSSITLVLDETHWHRINAKVASHVFSLLASVEGTTVCLEIPLQSPPPPPPGRPSLGDRLPPPTRETVAR